jgi:predicted RNase H-like HicB family nuclease
MLITYTAKYTKLEKGYMGQLLEWPEVITEGKTLEDCRLMLKDALQEMVAAYKELKMEIPQAANCLMEQLPVEVEGVSQTA